MIEHYCTIIWEWCNGIGYSIIQLNLFHRKLFLAKLKTCVNYDWICRMIASFVKFKNRQLLNLTNQIYQWHIRPFENSDSIFELAYNPFEFLFKKLYVLTIFATSRNKVLDLNISDKNKKCPSVDNYRILSVVCIL